MRISSKIFLFSFIALCSFTVVILGLVHRDMEPEFFKSEVLLVPEGPSELLISAIYSNKVITKARANKELGLGAIFEFDSSTKVLSFNARSVAELNRLVETTTTRIRAAALDILEKELNAQRKSIEQMMGPTPFISKPDTNVHCHLSLVQVDVIEKLNVIAEMETYLFGDAPLFEVLQSSPTSIKRTALETIVIYLLLGASASWGIVVLFWSLKRVK